MIKILVLSVIAVTVLSAEESPGFAIFNGQKIVWEDQPPKFDGTHHGDGVVTFPIIGYVLSFDDRDAIIPVVGAQVIQIPANNFGGVKEPAAVCVSDANGKVDFTVSLGAAIQIGGNHDGQVYQSSRQDYIIRAPGYKDRTISLCLNHPPFKVFIRKP
jgi:hypothetical protein